ncbi:MAG: MlaD family protein [Candidatus Margulisiibacteriota bacterium]
MSTQARVGAVLVTALVLLAALVSWKSAIFLKFSGYELTGSFQNIEGLTVGSEIRYRGFKVGKVMRIDPGTQEIRIYGVIDKHIKFPADSELRVAFDGLVGLKYLEITPGVSETVYNPDQVLYGKKTSGIVDFVDIGAQNLVETKRIFMAIREFVEDNKIREAFTNAVFNVEKATVEINRLTEQLQMATAGINKIVADKGFQENVKGTIASTNKTLTSANEFFENFGQIRLKPSADVLFGGRSNQIKGNLDISQNERNTWMIALGEGPTRNLALLDLQISSAVSKTGALRIGMINTHLGGGIDFRPNNNWLLSGDIYDFNNPKPNNPKLRFTTYYRVSDFVNMILQADDFINSGSGNYSIGVRVKAAGD